MDGLLNASPKVYYFSPVIGSSNPLKYQRIPSPAPSSVAPLITIIKISKTGRGTVKYTTHPADLTPLHTHPNIMMYSKNVAMVV
jgi:hypothetical protein